MKLNTHTHTSRRGPHQSNPTFRCAGLALVAGVFLTLTAGQARAQTAGWRAGMARTDITPPFPVMLAGYESRKELSRGVHDPLSARVVIFESSGQHLALVSIDNLGFYNNTAEPLRQAILEASGLKPSELFLCAIHTHSAPGLTLDAAKGHSNNVEYTKLLQGKLVEAVRAAWGRLAPVEVGAGSGSSPVGVNRREPTTDPAGQPRIVLGRNPAVMTDREVQVLRVRGPEGKEPVGLVFAYATHSTSLGPGNYLVSGDIHGLAAQFLEQYFGADMVAAEFAGASGNIDPWYRVLPAFKTTNGWVPEPVLQGTMLGEEVAHVLAGIKNGATSGPIRTAIKTIELPGKPRGASQGTASLTTPINLTVGRLGGIAFVGLGGEVFNELGQAIKSASPFRPTFILTHCNGAAGYVPTRPSYPEGGYEVQSSAFAPGAGESLVEEAGRMLRELEDGR